MSLIGTIIAAISLLFMAFLFAITFFFNQGSSYIGLFIYMVLPAFLIIGLLLIPIGMMLRIRKAKRQHEVLKKQWMTIDLNIREQRNALVIFTIGTIIFLFLSAIGSYEMFHYTESVQFCGTLCHTPMKPEYTAYQNSPHANVACVECHVGPGADWYVRSKLSGLYQVYSVTFNKFPRPISTPISNLRPARETCEECHWPEKFYSQKLVYEKHYLTDKENTEWNIQLKMKTAAENSAMGLKEGIHWHVNPNVKIEYLSSNDRESIPWVRYINLATHDTTIFEDSENPLKEDDKDKLAMRTMDCMDCHNRPSHNYQVPTNFVDQEISAGNIPRSLPDIKKISMDLFAQKFTNTDTALTIIDSTIRSYYTGNYPELASNNPDLIAQAVKGLQAGFNKNIFPEMNASWDAYPDHIGHMEFNGCFRCHNDTHATADGEKKISRDCNLCHDILLQGKDSSIEVAPFNSHLEFKHPVDIDQAWKEMPCSDCHRSMY